MTRASCEGCKYYLPLSVSSANSPKYCNFMLETGEKRGCSPENCTRKEVGTLPRRSTFGDFQNPLYRYPNEEMFKEFNGMYPKRKVFTKNHGWITKW